MEALLAACEAERWPARVVAVVSNRPEAAGLRHAAAQGIATAAVDHRAHADRARFDAALAQVIDSFAPDLVVLAGFMRILGEPFVRRYEGRLLNIHPSLLPAHKGLHTHRRAIEARDAQHGATVHFVTAELDGGPRILRGVLTLRPSDDEESLQRRVQRIEHAIYPEALELLARGRLRQTDAGAELDGQPLVEPLERHFDF